MAPVRARASRALMLGTHAPPRGWGTSAARRRAGRAGARGRKGDNDDRQKGNMKKKHHRDDESSKASRRGKSKKSEKVQRDQRRYCNNCDRSDLDPENEVLQIAPPVTGGKSAFPARTQSSPWCE